MDLINQGVDFETEKKYDEAILMYSKAIFCNRRMQLAFFNRANAYRLKGDDLNALADLNTVVELKSFVTYVGPNFEESIESQTQVEDGEVFFMRGIAKSKLDSLQSSYLDFHLAMMHGYPDSSECFLWQGILLLRGDKRKQACALFEKCVKYARSQSTLEEAKKLIATTCRESKDNG